jgi:ATP-binding cassette subfamily C protein CydC
MKHAFYFVRLMWREERRSLMIGTIASFLALLSAIALLGLSGWFITAAGLAGLAGAGLTFDFFRPSAGIRFLALFRTATRYGERLATHDATLRFFASLRANLFSSVAATREINRRFRSSELLQRLTGDIEIIDSLYLRFLLPTAVAAALALVGCLLLVSISVTFAIAVGTAFLASALIIYVCALHARKSARRIALGSEALRVRTIDLLHAQTDLIFSGGMAAQKSRIAKAAQYLSNAGYRLSRSEIGAASGIGVAGAGLTLAFIVLGGAAFEAGAITGPVMAMLVIGGFAALEVFAPLRRGAVEFGRIAFAGGRLHRLAEATAETDNRTFVERSLAIAVLDLTYRHAPNAQPIFRHYNFAARHGERIALIGKSGCGKSTLLSLIAGLRQPESGNILIGSKHGTQSALGYLTQETELFKGSVADNLRVAKAEASDEALLRALEIVELRNKIEALDGKLNWQLGETGNGLSGGERRRLALARLILRNPAIWLLDEPTAGLDDALARRVLDRLFSFAPDATFLIAAHHDREIERTSRVISLSA